VVLANGTAQEAGIEVQPGSPGNGDKMRAKIIRQLERPLGQIALAMAINSIIWSALYWYECAWYSYLLFTV
jgi:hypothetical protein